MYWTTGLYATAQTSLTVEGVPNFQAANPAGGVPNGTELTYPWFSDVQGELLNFLFSTGIAPAENTPNQVIQAVKRIAGGNATTVSQSTTLTADNAGLVLVNASAGNITITMPVVASANGAPLLFNIVRTDATANTVTYETAGTDKVQPTVATSGAIAAGGATQLLGDGVSNWWQPGSGRLINTETFTTVGTVTYTPSSGMRFVRFRMQTAGGGGGGAAGVAGNYVAVGAGGGSGVYAEGILTAAQIGASQPITLGAAGKGGEGGTSVTNAGAGGSCSIGSLVSQPGGSAGVYGISTNYSGNGNGGDAGGSTTPGNMTNCLVVRDGQYGGRSNSVWVGGTAIWVLAGAGASSMFSGGAQEGGMSQGSATNGNNADGYGGGGGGVANNNTAGATGGSGSGPILLIEEYA